MAPDHKQSPYRNKLDIAAWILIGLLVPITPIAPNPSVIIFAAIPAIAILGCRRYGWRLLAVYTLTTFTVGTVFENLSITTGFPFGHYHYPGNSLRIWHFPVVAGIIYCVLGMTCWLVAATLLDGADRQLADLTDPRRPVNVVAVPAVAAALMTMWDLGTDPVASTISRVWVWERGGGVFGVPYTNFLGWWFVTYVFFQIFALILATRNPATLPHYDGRRQPLAQAVAVYLVFAAAPVVRFVTAGGGTVTDLAGQTWSKHAIYETTLTFSLFGAVVMVALAAIKLARNDLAISARRDR